MNGDVRSRDSKGRTIFPELSRRRVETEKRLEGHVRSRVFIWKALGSLYRLMGESLQAVGGLEDQREMPERRRTETRGGEVAKPRKGHTS